MKKREKTERNKSYEDDCGRGQDSKPKKSKKRKTSDRDTEIGTVDETVSSENVVNILKENNKKEKKREKKRSVDSENVESRSDSEVVVKKKKKKKKRDGKEKVGVQTGDAGSGTLGGGSTDNNDQVDGSSEEKEECDDSKTAEVAFKSKKKKKRDGMDFGDVSERKNKSKDSVRADVNEFDSSEMVMKKKKRKDKRKCSDAELDQTGDVSMDKKSSIVNEHLDMSVGGSSVSKSGKKKKKQCDLDGKGEVGDVTVSKKSKKGKKDKVRDVEMIECPDIIQDKDEHSDFTSADKKKNKKKKEKDRDVVDENDDAIVCKEKKKKHKRRDLPVDVAVVENDDVIGQRHEAPIRNLTSELVNVGKKKKKRKHDCDVNQTSCGDDSVDNQLSGDESTVSKTKDKNKMKKESKKKKSDDAGRPVSKKRKIGVGDEVEQSGGRKLGMENGCVGSVDGNSEEANKNVNLGQWGSATFENKDRQDKFFRLLGGFKKKTNSVVQTTVVPVGVSEKKPNPFVNPKSPFLRKNLAMSKSEESNLNENLEKDFTRAMDWKLTMPKGTGLGYTPPPDANKKFYIDITKTNSVKFD